MFVETSNSLRPSCQGRNVYSLTDSNIIMAAEVKLSAGALELGTARSATQFNIARGTNVDAFDVTRNGDRFLLIEDKNEFNSRPITLVANWPEEIKRK